MIHSYAWNRDFSECVSCQQWKFAFGKGLDCNADRSRSTIHVWFLNTLNQFKKKRILISSWKVIFFQSLTSRTFRELLLLWTVAWKLPESSESWQLAMLAQVNLSTRSFPLYHLFPHGQKNDDDDYYYLNCKCVFTWWQWYYNKT
jgi:hypothetical protein